MSDVQTKQISSTFIWRRVHSLMGFWLLLYLIVHLVTNSQAAIWLGEGGAGFVRMVNSLESLPFLHVIEVTLIGIPLAIHGVWGIHRAWIARTNSGHSNGSKPSIQAERNRAFTWQRLTSWILLFGIIGHVVQMRFVEQPRESIINGETRYVVRVSDDERLPPLANKLGVTLYKEEAECDWLAAAPSPGAAMLLMVRDTFKSPVMIVLYTVFLLAAAFHAFNGFWTFLITWGVLLSFRSQRAMIPVSVIGMGLLTFLGLAAIWGSYWIGHG